jgi:hypothetical protein
MERYNGWRNRATWQASLWITNDLCHIDEDLIDAVQRGKDQERVAQLAEGLVNDVLLPEGPAGLLGDIVSDWMEKVDWNEIADHYMADNAPEPEEAEAE